jgi:hypothetical protein
MRHYDGEDADKGADDWVFGLDLDWAWHELQANNADRMSLETVVVGGDVGHG